jgi:Concanavalin A-like lectin/glucanases superfamily
VQSGAEIGDGSVPHVRGPLRVCGACVLLMALAACGRLDFASTPDAAFSILDVGPNATYPEVVLASAPRMYYRLNETGVGVAADASGNGYAAEHFIDGGMLTFGRPGALAGDPDTAVRMEGDGNSGPNVGASIQFAAGNIDWAGDFTVELFYVPNAPSPVGWSQVVFVCEDYMVSGFRVGWNEADQVHLWTDEGGATGNLATVGGTFDMTSFRHVAVVRQGQTFTIYVDAVAVGSGVVDYIPAGATSDCGFGALHGMPSYGTYDEVAIYARALGQAELTSHVAAR